MMRAENWNKGNALTRAEAVTLEAVQRFWEKAQQSPQGECWEWRAARSIRGYGVFFIKSPARTTIPAHRFAYLLYHGDVPAGKFVCHRCDNPPCVNPGHLWLGDNESNSADRVAKERQARGSTHGKAKLTEEQVRVIKIMNDGTKATEKMLADLYGVSQVSIWLIWQGRHWAHVT